MALKLVCKATKKWRNVRPWQWWTREDACICADCVHKQNEDICALHYLPSTFWSSANWQHVSMMEIHIINSRFAGFYIRLMYFPRMIFFFWIWQLFTRATFKSMRHRSSYPFLPRWMAKQRWNLLFVFLHPCVWPRTQAHDEYSSGYLSILRPFLLAYVSLQNH